LLEKQIPRLAMLQDRDQFRGRQAHVQRCDGAARHRHTVISLEQLVRVEAEICDPVSVLESFRFESRREPSTPLAKLGIGEPLFARNNTCLRAEEFDRPIKEADWSEGQEHANGSKLLGIVRRSAVKWRSCISSGRASGRFLRETASEFRSDARERQTAD